MHAVPFTPCGNDSRNPRSVSAKQFVAGKSEAEMVPPTPHVWMRKVDSIVDHCHDHSRAAGIAGNAVDAADFCVTRTRID